jgi:hypothetical protein
MDITYSPEPVPPQYQDNFSPLFLSGIVLGPVIGVPLGLLVNYDQFVFWGLGIGFVSFMLLIPCFAIRPWYQRAAQASDLRVPVRFQFMLGEDRYDTQTADLVGFRWVDEYMNTHAVAVWISRVKRRPFMIRWYKSIDEGKSPTWPGPLCDFFSDESELIAEVGNKFGPVGLDRLAGFLVSVAGEEPHHIQTLPKDA